jgi:hypothetical protein
VTVVLEQNCIAVIYISFVQPVEIKNVIYKGSEFIVLKIKMSPVQQGQILFSVFCNQWVFRLREQDVKLCGYETEPVILREEEREHGMCGGGGH